MTEEEWNRIVKTPEIDNLMKVTFRYGFVEGVKYAVKQTKSL